MVVARPNREGSTLLKEGVISADGRAALALALPVGGIAAWMIVRWIERTALRRAWLDHPNQRSSHSTPTPRGGGLAIVVVTVAGALMVPATGDRWSSSWALVLGCAVCVAGVSWIDDLRSVPSSIRMAVHLIAAAVAVILLGPIAAVELPGASIFHTSLMAIPLSILWVVGLTNVYNFMDGIDGIAGLQAVVAGVAWVIIGSVTQDSRLAVTAAFLAVSSAAFLLRNWSPARIFMGDVGSAFLGYLFAVFALARCDNPRVPLAAALIVWPFLFDATLTIVRRLARAENITIAHNTHLYQRLVRAGWSHRAVATLYGILAVIGSLFAVGTMQDAPGSQAVYGVIPLAAAGLWRLVILAERSALKRRPPEEMA